MAQLLVDCHGVQPHLTGRLGRPVEIAGAGDPARDYKREARYVDAGRTHLVYEAGWPTTIGVDFKLRAHQYTSNEQNLNDFVLEDKLPVNATIGFEQLAKLTGRPAKSLHRMLSATGNPSMDNLASVFDVLRDALKVEIEVHVVEAA